MDSVEFNKYFFIEYIKNFDSLEEIDAAKYEEKFKEEVNYYDIKYDIYARSTAPRWLADVSHERLSKI